MKYRHCLPWFALLATSTLSAQQAAPTPAGQQLSAAAQQQLEDAAARLGESGLPVDLDRLTVSIRTRDQVRASQHASLLAEFGAERADLYRVLLQSYGRQYNDGTELLGGMARSRARGLLAHYDAGSNELMLVAEEIAELGLHQRDLLRALSLAGRHQAGAELFEAPDGETLDGFLTRQAILNGGSAVDAKRAGVEAPVGKRDRITTWLRRLQLESIDTESWVLGATNLEVVTSGEALSELWSERLTSSEQLMHLLKRRRDLPTEVTLPAWPEKLADARIAHEDTLGEAGILILLMEHGVPRPKAEQAATGWDGDRIRHAVTAEGENVMVWRSIWDRPADAQAFAQEWIRRAGGEVSINGRVVDWVLSNERSVWNKVLKGLAAAPIRKKTDAKDAASTKRIEDEAFETRRSAPYVVGNEWRHPSLDMVITVPVGWYEDERDGVTYMVRTKTAGYRDNVHVTARMARDARNIDQLIALNEELLREDFEHEFISAEKRTMQDGREVGVLRYQRHEGGHDIIFTTMAILQDRAQIGVTIGIELTRWDKMNPIVEQILSDVRMGDVRPLEK